MASCGVWVVAPPRRVSRMKTGAPACPRWGSGQQPRGNAGPGWFRVCALLGASRRRLPCVKREQFVSVDAGRDVHFSKRAAAFLRCEPFRRDHRSPPASLRWPARSGIACGSVREGRRERPSQNFFEAETAPAQNGPSNSVKTQTRASRPITQNGCRTCQSTARVA